MVVLRHNETQKMSLTTALKPFDMGCREYDDNDDDNGKM